MHPGDEGEPDTITVGELVAKLQSYAADWPIVVRVCGMQFGASFTPTPDGENLELTMTNFDCILDPEDVHADRGAVIFCVGNEQLEELLFGD